MPFKWSLPAWVNLDWLAGASSYSSRSAFFKNLWSKTLLRVEQFRALDRNGVWLLAKAFFTSKAGIASLVALAFFSWLKVHDSKIKRAERAEVFQESKQEGAKANARSQKIHSTARAPGAADRLRKDSCRDC